MFDQIPERRHKRVEISLKTVIIAGRRKYTGNTRNISEEGIGCIIFDYIREKTDFASGKAVSLIVLTPSHHTLSLNCEIRWLSETFSTYQKKYVGAKIIAPSAMYKKFFRDTLSSHTY